jgi:hypothetical protein
MSFLRNDRLSENVTGITLSEMLGLRRRGLCPSRITGSWLFGDSHIPISRLVGNWLSVRARKYYPVAKHACSEPDQCTALRTI